MYIMYLQKKQIAFIPHIWSFTLARDLLRSQLWPWCFQGLLLCVEKVTDPIGDTPILYWTMMGRVKGLGFLDFFRGSFNSKKKAPWEFYSSQNRKGSLSGSSWKHLVPFFFLGPKKALFLALWHISECWFPSNHEVILSFLGWERTTKS